MRYTKSQTTPINLAAQQGRALPFKVKAPFMVLLISHYEIHLSYITRYCSALTSATDSVVLRNYPSTIIAPRNKGFISFAFNRYRLLLQAIFPAKASFHER